MKACVDFENGPTPILGLGETCHSFDNVEQWLNALYGTEVTYDLPKWLKDLPDICKAVQRDVWLRWTKKFFAQDEVQISLHSIDDCEQVLTKLGWYQEIDHERQGGNAVYWFPPCGGMLSKAPDHSDGEKQSQLFLKDFNVWMNSICEQADLGSPKENMRNVELVAVAYGRVIASIKECFVYHSQLTFKKFEEDKEAMCGDEDSVSVLTQIAMLALTDCAAENVFGKNEQLCSFNLVNGIKLEISCPNSIFRALEPHPVMDVLDRGLERLLLVTDNVFDTQSDETGSVIEARLRNYPPISQWSADSACIPSLCRYKITTESQFEALFAYACIQALDIIESIYPSPDSGVPKRVMQLSCSRAFFLASIPILSDCSIMPVSRCIKYWLSARLVVAQTALISVAPKDAWESEMSNSLRKCIREKERYWRSLQEFAALHLLRLGAFEENNDGITYLPSQNLTSTDESNIKSHYHLDPYVAEQVSDFIEFFHDANKCQYSAQFIYDVLDNLSLAPVDIFEIDLRIAKDFCESKNLVVPSGRNCGHDWSRTAGEIVLGLFGNICHRLSINLQNNTGKSFFVVRGARLLTQLLLSEQHLLSLANLSNSRLIADIGRTAEGSLNCSDKDRCDHCAYLRRGDQASSLSVADVATLYLLQPLQPLADSDYGSSVVSNHFVWNEQEELLFSSAVFGMSYPAYDIDCLEPLMTESWHNLKDGRHTGTRDEGQIEFRNYFEDIQKRRARRLYLFLRVLFPFVLPNCPLSIMHSIDSCGAKHNLQSEVALARWLKLTSRAASLTAISERSSWHAVLPGSVTRLLFYSLCRQLAAPPSRLGILILRMFYETMPGSSLFMYRLPTFQRRETGGRTMDIGTDTEAEDVQRDISTDRTAQTAVTNGLHLDMWSRALVAVFSQALPVQGAVIPCVDSVVAAARRGFQNEEGKNSSSASSVSMATLDTTEMLANDANYSDYLQLNNLVSNLTLMSRNNIPSAVLPLDEVPIEDFADRACPFHGTFFEEVNIVEDHFSSLRQTTVMPDEVNERVLVGAVGILNPKAASATYHRRRYASTMGRQATHPPSASLLSLVAASFPRIASALSRTELSGEVTCPIHVLRIFPGPAHIRIRVAAEDSTPYHSLSPTGSEASRHSGAGTKGPSICTCERGMLIASPFKTTQVVVRTPLALYLDLLGLLQNLFCTAPISPLAPPASHPCIATLTSQLTYLSSFASATAPKRLLAALSSLTSCLLSLTANSYALTAVCLAHCSTSLVVSTSPLISRIQSPTLTLSSSLLARFLPGATMHPLSIPLFDSLFAHLFRTLHDVSPDLFPVPHPTLAVRATFAVRASTLLLPFFLVRPSLISFLQAVCTTAAASSPPQKCVAPENEELGDSRSLMYESPMELNNRRRHAMVPSALSFVSARVCLLVRPLFRSLARYYRDAVPVLRSPQAPHPMLQKLLLGKMQIQKHIQQQVAAAAGVELPMQLVAYFKALGLVGKSGHMGEASEDVSEQSEDGDSVGENTSQSSNPVAQTASLSSNEIYRVDERGSHSAFSLAPLSLVLPLVNMLDTLRVLPLCLRTLPFFIADAFPQSGMATPDLRRSETFTESSRLLERSQFDESPFDAFQSETPFSLPGESESTLVVLYLVSQLLFELIPQPLTPPSVALVKAALAETEGRHVTGSGLVQDVTTPHFGARSPAFGPGSGPIPLEDPSRLLAGDNVHKERNRSQYHESAEDSTEECGDDNEFIDREYRLDELSTSELTNASVQSSVEAQADAAVISKLLTAEAESLLTAAAASVAPISSSASLAAGLVPAVSSAAVEAAAEKQGIGLGSPVSEGMNEANVLVNHGVGALELLTLSPTNEGEARLLESDHLVSDASNVGPVIHDFDEDVDRMLLSADSEDSERQEDSHSTFQSETAHSEVFAVHRIGSRRRRKPALTQDSVPNPSVDLQTDTSSKLENLSSENSKAKRPRLMQLNDLDVKIIHGDGELARNNQSKPDIANGIDIHLEILPLESSKASVEQVKEIQIEKLMTVSSPLSHSPSPPYSQSVSLSSFNDKCSTEKLKSLHASNTILRRAVILAPAAVEFAASELLRSRSPSGFDLKGILVSQRTGIATEAAILPPEIILAATLQALAWSKADSAGAIWPLFRRTFAAIRAQREHTF